MVEDDKVYFKQFPLATQELNTLMLRVLNCIDEMPHPVLLNLVRINFLCATTGKTPPET